MATYKKWTQHEIDFIVNNHTTLRDEQIAAKLSQISGNNITTSMIRRQRRKLSIKKSRGRPKKFTSITSNATPVENV
jgi:hypothetical protein